MRTAPQPSEAVAHEQALGENRTRSVVETDDPSGSPSAGKSAAGASWRPLTAPATPTTMCAPVTAVDKLRTIYRRPGPYISVYMATLPLLPTSDDNIYSRWKDLRRDLEVQGASMAALAAIEDRLVLPGPEDTAGIALLAADDGTVVVDYGLEPPRHDLGIVDTLPYVAPLLEWQQRRIAHLVVTVDGAGADVATFGLDHYVGLESYELEPEALAEQIVKTARLSMAELVVVSGEPGHLGHLAGVLPQQVPLNCRVVTDSSATDAEQLTEFVVRCLSDLAAEATVNRLQDQRFFAGHDAAVDGTADTVAALANGTADRILLHDDPNDQRRMWIGTEVTELSLELRRDWVQARFVDALIRSAVLQDTPVHIIPSTGPNGPEDDIAALTDS